MELHRKAYEDRIPHFKNKAAQDLLMVIVRKQSNLCVALDVVDVDEMFRIADAVGPYVCCIKTHVDILLDFEYQSFSTKIQELAKKHDFLIFEDRKFADIGQTVRNQYAKGVYKIRNWSDFTNAHPIPGDGIVDGLAAEGLEHGKGLLLLAEMSSKGTLAKGKYAYETLEMACRHQDFVFGFIGQHRLSLEKLSNTSLTSLNTDFLYLTPGVNLESKGDNLGQQYNTPDSVILDNECDVIIVGRGIIKSDTPSDTAKIYKEAGWDAYLRKLEKYKS